MRGLVQRDGTWVWSQRFGPYGRVLVTSGPGPGFALRYAWTGREYDAETGWYFFRARYFDPAVRRFVQEDPLGYGGGVNVYAYVGGGPLEARDPSGLRVKDVFGQAPDPENPLDVRGGSAGFGGGGFWDELDALRAYDDAVWAEQDRLQRAQEHGGVIGARVEGNSVVYTYGDGTQEIRSGGSRTWRDNNPGALGYGGFARSHGAMANQNGMAVFPNEAAGWQAEVALLMTSDYQSRSLEQTIASWCGGPPAGCHTANYQAYVRNATGYNGSARLSDLDPWLVADAIRSYETWNPGTVTWVVP